MPSKVDRGVIDETYLYVALGIPPGGFTTSLLLGDLPRAKSRCHKHALPWFDSTYIAVRSIIPLLSCDTIANIQYWISHSGFNGIDDSSKLEYYLSHQEHMHIINKLIKKYHR